jgi:hypothetical protein
MADIQALVEAARSYRSPLLSRKFLLAIGVLASATFLVFDGKIADGVYSAVVIATVGAYIAGNVMQKKSEVKA